MKLIVGLGNPGDKYGDTRHNVGASVAGDFAEHHAISLRRRKYKSFFGEGRVSGEELIIILPLTYMNLSGEAVSSVIKDKEIDLSNTLIICDDADLQLGDIRLRAKGSDGGHKGLRSIIYHLGSDDFPRLRIGIGRDADLRGHVLRPFKKGELRLMAEVKERSVGAVECWIQHGIAPAMNLYNTRSRSGD
ncbi:MAG: aminoacyl-tRNA hydrolase [Candidatus Omnitrophica bacterium]|nr:aminoacyl-tRNA hydrolase [Candidatus Omnitrophota bacterium]